MPKKRQLQVRLEPDLNRGEPAMCDPFAFDTMFSRHGIRRSCLSDDCVVQRTDPSTAMLIDTLYLYRDLLKPRRLKRRTKHV